MYAALMDAGDLDAGLLEAAFSQLLEVNDVRVRAALCATLSTTLIQRGPRAHEVLAIMRVVRALDGLSVANQRDLRGGDARVIVLMGSGKKGARCLNISTPSALLACVAGASVAKVAANCTSRITSSVEFITAIGVNVDLPGERMRQVLRDTGFGYFKGGEEMAPKFFATYKGTCVTPHALMFGWPILSPVKGDVVVYGLAHPRVDVAAEVLAGLGLENAVVVGGCDGNRFYDEYLPFGETYVSRVSAGQPIPLEHKQFGSALGLMSAAPLDVRARASADDDVRTAMSALAGYGKSGYLEALALNAAGILQAGGCVTEFAEGFKRCRVLLAEGAALNKLREVVEATGGDSLLTERWTRDLLPAGGRR